MVAEFGLPPTYAPDEYRLMMLTGIAIQKSSGKHAQMARSNEQAQTVELSC
jgi:hypothetical protein